MVIGIIFFSGLALVSIPCLIYLIGYSFTRSKLDAQKNFVVEIYNKNRKGIKYDMGNTKT